MESHSHCWKLEPYERYISVGFCACGAKRYFANVFGTEEIARANELNRELGWEPVRYRPGATDNINKHKEEETMKEQPEVEANPSIEIIQTREQKARIAREAQQKGVKETAILYDTPWKYVRAWIGAYCRRPKAERLLDAVKSKASTSAKAEAAVTIKKSKPSTAAGTQSPSNTEAHKGNPLVYLGRFRVEIADEMPSFPEFNNEWPMLTQIEWLQTYKEMAMKGNHAG